ncbi:MAG TPA: hypothetical protein VK425_00190 [Acidimicrobiales bacterium]|nr:hypothetical protein [Acidimicrobiales bacterium]
MQDRPEHLRARPSSVLLAVAVLISSLAVSPSALAGTTSPTGALQAAKVKILGWGFDEPAGIAVEGEDVFVTNAASNTVTELVLPQKTLVRVIEGPQYRFDEPLSAAVYGSDLWVLSDPQPLPDFLPGLEPPGLLPASEGHLTEVDTATGQLVRVVGGTSYGMDGAVAMTLDGPDLFVVDSGTNQVTEVDATTGRLVRLVNSPGLALAEPRAITSIGPDLFVANDEGGAGGTVTEFRASTGQLVQVIGGARYKFSQPELLASYGPNLFVFSLHFGSGQAAGSVTEIATNAIAERSTATTSTTATPPPITTTTTTTTPRTTTTTALAGVTTTSDTAPSSTSISAVATGPTSTVTTTTSATEPAAGTPTATVVRYISGSQDHLGAALSAIVQGNDLYVASLAVSGSSGQGGFSVLTMSSGGSVLEIDARTGALVRADSGTSCGLNMPYGLAVAGNQILVTDFGGDALSDVSTLTGGCAGSSFGSAYQFDHPAAMAIAHGHLIVGGQILGALFSGTEGLVGAIPAQELTEVNPSTGALQRVIVADNDAFDSSAGLVASGNDVFATRFLGGRVTVVDAGTGAMARVISLGPSGSFAASALAVSGRYLFVGGASRTSNGSGTVRELDITTGSTTRMIGGKQYHFGVPVSMAVNGADLFVVTLNQDSAGNNIWALTEVSIPDGQLVRVFPNAAYALDNPDSVFSYGPYVFVASLGPSQSNLNGGYGPGAITQIEATTGTLIRVIRGARYELKGESAMASLGGDLYVADTAADAVTVIDPATGVPRRVLSGSEYGFAAPDGLATWGDHLYVANGEGQTVTDIELGP